MCFVANKSLPLSELSFMDFDLSEYKITTAMKFYFLKFAILNFHEKLLYSLVHLSHFSNFNHLLFGPRSGPTKCRPDLDPNCLTL